MSKIQSFGIVIIVDGQMETAAEQLRGFLTERKISLDVARDMKLKGKLMEDGETWLAIPYKLGGRTTHHKYRKLSAKEFRSDPGAKHDLYNADCLAAKKNFGQPIVITEGELDCLSVIQSGFERCVSVPDGWSENLTEPTAKKAQVFLNHEKDINAAPKVIAALDNDRTGRALLQAIYNLFPEVDIRYVTWPEDCKDANDTLKVWGEEYVKACIEQAKPLNPPGGQIFSLADVPPKPERQIWKLDDLSDRMAWRSREISVLTGIPGSGKSTFAVWASLNLLDTYPDLRIGLAMFETEPYEVLEQFSSITRLTNEEVVAKYKDRFCFLQQQAGADEYGMQWLKRMVHTAASREGCKIIFIDPWNELEHMPERGEHMTYYTNAALMALRKWAERYDIHICVIAHPRKLDHGEIPYGYHIEGSASWMNKPGMGYTVHVDEEGEVKLITWKVRDRQGTGCFPGTTRLSFSERTKTYKVKEYGA